VSGHFPRAALIEAIVASHTIIGDGFSTHSVGVFSPSRSSLTPLSLVVGKCVKIKCTALCKCAQQQHTTHLIGGGLDLQSHFIHRDVVLDDDAANLAAIVCDVDLLVGLELDIRDVAEAVTDELIAAELIDAATMRPERGVRIEAHRVACVGREIDAILIVTGRVGRLHGVNAARVVEPIVRREGAHPHADDRSLGQALTG
jgi:hypothetical protein